MLRSTSRRLWERHSIIPSYVGNYIATRKSEWHHFIKVGDMVATGSLKPPRGYLAHRIVAPEWRPINDPWYSKSTASLRRHVALARKKNEKSLRHVMRMFEAYLPHADMQGKRTVQRFWELRPAQEMVRNYRLLRMQGVEHDAAFRDVVRKWNQRRNAIVRQQQIATNTAIRSGASLTMANVRPLLAMLNHLQMEGSVGSAYISEITRDVAESYALARKNQMANGAPATATEAEVEAFRDSGFDDHRSYDGDTASPYSDLLKKSAADAAAAARGKGVSLVAVRDVPPSVRMRIAERLQYGLAAESPSWAAVADALRAVVRGTATRETVELPPVVKGKVHVFARMLALDPLWQENPSVAKYKNLPPVTDLAEPYNAITELHQQHPSVYGPIAYLLGYMYLLAAAHLDTLSRDDLARFRYYCHPMWLDGGRPYFSQQSEDLIRKAMEKWNPPAQQPPQGTEEAPRSDSTRTASAAAAQGGASVGGAAHSSQRTGTAAQPTSSHPSASSRISSPREGGAAPTSSPHGAGATQVPASGVPDRSQPRASSPQGGGGAAATGSVKSRAAAARARHKGAKQ